MTMKQIVSTAVMCFALFLLPFVAAAEEEKDGDSFEIPNHVLDISKENTAPNDASDKELVEPSKETKEILESSAVTIENDELIKLLNETTIKPSPIAFGYRAEIYLGRWPLHYESQQTTVNWEYQPINKNELANVTDVQQEMSYIQQEAREINGMLTSRITNSDTVRMMMLKKTEEKTKLPLSYQVVIGKNTQLTNVYPVPPEKTGVLEAFAPAVNEKGEVTFGEVYIELKGTKKQVRIKNVTKQEVGAWIPVQNHVAYSFQLH